VERAARNAGPLLERCEQADRAASGEQDAGDPATATMEKTTANSPLLPMTPEERLVADFRGTGMTVGPHPMKYHRASMKRQGVLTASELNRLPDGTHVRVAGGVIARQRPGTAKGFVFLSIEDETGIANAIVTPRVFEEHHVTIVQQQFLLIEGQLQHQDNVVSVKVESVQPLSITGAETTSHDFH
jgi:error-prone DNA polymerase